MSNRVLAFSHPGLGAIIHVDPEGAILWIGLFGMDFTGADLVLSGTVRDHGLATLYRQRAGSLATFPNTNTRVAGMVGGCKPVLSADEQKLELTITVDAFKLGADKLPNFSPPIEQEHTTTITLNRLA